MTNFEKYKDVLSTVNFGLVDGKPVKCTDLDNCRACDISNGCICDHDKWAWLKEEYVEPPVDWSTVEVDTPILVSHDGELWHRRYFASFENDKVYSWRNGATSWSADSSGYISRWEYAKLAEEVNK